MPEEAGLSSDSSSLHYLGANESGEDEDDFVLIGYESDSSADTYQSVPAQPRPTVSTDRPPAKPAGDFELQLAQARERKEKAFVRYTRLVTGTGGEPDEIQLALKQYKQAYADLKELESRLK